MPARTYNRKGVTPIFVYSGDDLDIINDAVWQDIQKFGRPLTFGSTSDPLKSKRAWEVFSVMQMYGGALERLYNGDVPAGWLFGGKSNQVYIEMLKDTDPHDQPYSYGQRLHIKNRMCAVKRAVYDSMRTGIQTNRIVGILWDRDDIYEEHPPCFNWWQLRLMEENLFSLRTLFRSHDYVDANFPNYGAIVRYFTDEVLEPNGAELSELINVSTSAQIQAGDVDTVFNRVGNWLNLRSFFNVYSSN